MSRFFPSEIPDLYVHEQFPDRIFLYKKTENKKTAFAQEETVSLKELLKSGIFYLFFCGEDSTELIGTLLRRVPPWPDSQILFVKERQIYRRIRLMRIHENLLRLSGTVSFDMENYGLELNGGTMRLLTGQDGDVLDFEAGYTFLLRGGIFYCGRGLRLAMDAFAGCFQFCLEGLTTLKELGVLISFTKEIPVVPDVISRGTYISAVMQTGVQPLEPVSTPFHVSASIDVLQPEDAARSFLTLPAGKYRTGFAVALADNLLLEAESGTAARLVFSRERMYRNSGVCRYRLSPCGKFRIVSEDGELLTGSSGLEYIRFARHASFSFHCGCAAHFLPDRREADDSGLTSYIAAGGVYYAQGQEAAFFTRSHGIEYDLLEIPYGSLTDSLPFPALPLAGSPAEYLEQMETTAVQPLRTEVLAAASMEMRMQAVLRRALNDNGTVIFYEPGSSQISRLELGDKFRFASVRGSLKKALLCARPFLVVADVSAFLQEADYIPEASPFVIDGWQFDCSPQKWSPDTLLVIKYTADRSIAEFAALPGEWSYPQTDEKRKKAAAVLQRTLDGMTGELKELAQDRQWCGAVLFGLPVESGSLPAEIRFLTNVGKPPDLTWQYLTFDQRTVNADGEILPAKISGRIHYENHFYGAPDRQYDFYYQLNGLSVQFRNSTLQDMTCEMSVALFYLLGSPLEAADSDTGNFIPIRGWRNKEADDTGVSRFCFELKESRTYFFSSSAVERMEIHGAKLLAAQDAGRVAFYFSGGLFFHMYESDLFSYGEDADGSQYPLLFSDLEILAGGDAYTGSMDHLKFSAPDPDRVRRNSLGRSFPPEIEKLGSYSGQTPEQSGYEGIDAEGIRQKELGRDWSGLHMAIHLGGLGALAGTSDLKLHLLLAWSASDIRRAYDGSISTELPGLYVGLKIGDLPGTSMTLPIQGIMSMGVEAVALKKQVPAPEDAQTEYYFLFQDFVLKLFQLQFPYGSSRIYVFGSPDGDAGQKQLAFYGAYERE